MSETQYVKQVQQQADAYTRTIEALVCLDSVLRYDDDSQDYRAGSMSFQGRGMTASGQDVAPDLVVQFDSIGGIVSEMKITASSEEDFDSAQQQVRTYDDELVGWDTSGGAIDSYDLCLVVPYPHAGSAGEFFRRVEEESAYSHSFVLLSVARDDLHHSHLAFENRLGEFSDMLVRAKFESRQGIVTVPLEKIVGVIGGIKFYDAKPECVEYTMDVLWSQYFTGDLPSRQVPRRGKQVEQKHVQPSTTAEDLREPYALFAQGQVRQPEIPKTAWIKDALDTYVAIGHAELDDHDRDVYWVEYNPRAWSCNLAGFARQVYKESAKKRRTRYESLQDQQPRLIEDNP